MLLRFLKQNLAVPIQVARISERAVRKITDITGQPRKEAPAVPVLPGLEG
jgi:hypothetical protein